LSKTHSALLATVRNIRGLSSFHQSFPHGSKISGLIPVQSRQARLEALFP
jgi:hypothetical protein